MALSPEHEAQILRYYHAERWRIGTIAAQLGLHRDTVARVLAQAGLPRHGAVQRASAIDPYLPFLHETLAQFPRLTAERLYDMVRARGYPGHSRVGSCPFSCRSRVGSLSCIPCVTVRHGSCG